MNGATPNNAQAPNDHGASRPMSSPMSSTRDDDSSAEPDPAQQSR